jgi:hypothetical protein
MSLVEDSDHSKHFLHRYMARPRSLRSVLPKVVLLGAFVAAVMLWMTAVPYYKEYSLSDAVSNQPVATVPTTPESTSSPAVDPMQLEVQPDPIEPDPIEPDPIEPDPSVALPQADAKHVWGVQTPYHLYGEGAKNRTQIGKEKASLVMLVRYGDPVEL